MNFETFNPAETNPAIYQKASMAAEALIREDAVPDKKLPDWNRVFGEALMEGAAFIQQQVPERSALLGAFMRAGDLGFIFAPRGVGKTWLALLMAGAIARGSALGEWAGGNSGCLRVCYVDGEVNLPDAIDRAALTELPPEVHWLHHERVADATGRGLNLADVSQQEGLLALLLERDIKVLFLDNLSCLFNGVAENEADAWEAVLPWLLKLRRHSITVILVAHAGRNGEMRGTSRREDAAHWIIKLQDAGDSDSAGAVFKSRFVKNRNARQAAASCPPLLWSLKTEGNRFKVTCTRQGDVELLAELVAGGMTSARDLAEELDVTKGTISKWAKKAKDRGLIRIEGRCYKPA